MFRRLGRRIYTLGFRSRRPELDLTSFAPAAAWNFAEHCRGHVDCNASVLAAVVAIVLASFPHQPSVCDGNDDGLDGSDYLPGERKFDAARWAETLECIKDGIVSLKVTTVRAFDTHAAGAGHATGFVVDAEQGLILTNRHVVTEGPVVAEALFDNHEEVEVRALYRDPVHDFGVFQYDPKILKHLKRVPELKLRPDKAVQGLDVRVIGNNAGEKLSVLGAMLARLDREAPTYGRRTYNDFNTFYFQAASATSGGSSGSPVIDCDGDVVALNAAGKVGTAASYYLPLDRVKRAVDLIRMGKPVTRGTLQTTFVFTPFFELLRLGLSEEEMQASRDYGEKVGMLVVGSVVPGGPASGILEPGDILLSIAGVRVTRFTPLEEAIDTAVGENIEITAERGGRHLKLIIHVQDLHAVTPHAYLDCGNAVFNNLSYQQARINNLPVDGLGVYVAAQGYMLRMAGIPSGSLILQVGQQRTRNIHELEAALSSQPEGVCVPVYYMNVGNRAQRSVAMLRVDRKWFPMQLVCRDDPSIGDWIPRLSPPAPEPSDAVDRMGATMGGKARFAPGNNDVEKKLTRCFAKVAVSVPLPVDGMPGTEFVGNGAVVDAERGLVLCDRSTVPGFMCDCLLTFGSSCTIPAHVAYVHPLHNLAVLSYDPRLVEGMDVQAISLKPCSSHDLRGEKLWHVALVGSNRTGCMLVSDKGVATESEPPTTPLSHPPRWQETNIDLISLRGASVASTQDGLIADDNGDVVAYWACFLTQTTHDGRVQDGHYFAGITADTIEDMVAPLRQGEPPPVLYALGAEMEKLGLAAVRGMLVDAATLEEVEAKCKHWPPQIMSVRRLWAETGAQKLLRDNDLVLEIDGRHLETFRDIDVAVAGKQQVTLLIVRDGHKLKLEVPTAPMTHGVTDRIVLWCGAVLQAPHPPISTQRCQPRCGVYISSRFHGSPAATYNLPPMSRIVEVDGCPTPNLDALLRVVATKKDGESVRIKRLDLRGAPSISCVRIDTKHWPTTEYRQMCGPRNEGGVEPYHWRRSAVVLDYSTGDVVFRDLSDQPSIDAKK